MTIQDVELTDNAAQLPPRDQPTGRKVGYLLALAAERQAPKYGTCAEERMEAVHALVMERPLNWRQVGQMIDWFKRQPRDADVTSHRPTDDFDSDTLDPGVYEKDGKIYVVQFNRNKTHKYAKEVIEAPSDRLNLAGEAIKIRHEYVRGAVRGLRPEDKMSLERAHQYLLRFGQCVRCGRFLEVKRSVERSLGPVCVKYFKTA